MKKEITKQLSVGAESDHMRAEYDLASMKGGVRGKYYKAYRAGHTVKIQQSDGTTLDLQSVSIIYTPLQHLLPEYGGPRE